MTALDKLYDLFPCDTDGRLCERPSEDILQCYCARVVEETWQTYVKTDEWVTTEGNFLDWFADLLEEQK